MTVKTPQQKLDDWIKSFSKTSQYKDMRQAFQKHAREQALEKLRQKSK